MNPENITNRLRLFRYTYTTDSFKDEPAVTVLKIYLPALCYLKVSFFEKSIKMSSRILYGFNFLSLEYNFFIYATGLALIAAFSPPQLNMAILIFLALILVHFLVCFIKLESLKTVIHRWIEEDMQQGLLPGSNKKK